MNNFLQGLQTLLGLAQHPAPTAGPTAAARAVPMRALSPYQPLPQLQKLPMLPRPGMPQSQPQFSPSPIHLGTSDTLAPMYAPQGGSFNPGFTPLQNSGFGPGGQPQIQAFNSPQQQNFGPQQGINLY